MYWVCMNYWLHFNGAYDFNGGVYQEEKSVRAAAVTEVRRKRRGGTIIQSTRRKIQYSSSSYGSARDKARGSKSTAHQ